MPDPYMNIDGVRAITSVDCLAYDTSYSTMSGYEDTVSQIYTRIAVEVPDALLGPVVIADYWTNAPVGMSKFATSLTFQTSQSYEPDSLSVYVNGTEVSWSVPSGVVDPTIFQVDLPQDDGYMWISYLPVITEASKTVGDTRDILEAADTVMAETILPLLDMDLIIRARRSVTNLEVYLSMVPTPWIGGRMNTTRSGPSNLLPGKTPVFAGHILELQEAIQRVEDYFDTLVPISLPRYEFSTVEYDDVFMVQYVEEIFSAIQAIETIILDPTYYGG